MVDEIPLDLACFMIHKLYKVLSKLCLVEEVMSMSLAMGEKVT